MNSENYLTCPKCTKRYHHKAGDVCPNCGVNIPEHLRKQQEHESAKLAVAADIEASKINYCLQCGSKFARPKTKTQGSFLIEIILWLAILIPGLIYTIWRLTTRYKACPICGAAQIIPTNSPAAQAALGQK